jgi:antirestriction protein ArdC
LPGLRHFWRSIMTTVLRDLYQSVTDQIVAALEAGTPPWVRPWRGTSQDARPANATTGRPYRGVNTLLLNLRAMACGYASNRWLTFAQAQSIGARVRHGEHGSQIVFFKMREVDDPVPASDGAAVERRVVPLLRAFTVFNVDQVEGLPAGMAAPEVEPGTWEPLEVADRILEASGARIRYDGSRAFYMPDADLIQMPPAPAFDHASDFYATALHELTHWTGHPSRCNRPLGKRHGIEAYAYEELVAEMGSAFLSDYCGIESRLQHASYIASWLTALRNDKQLIFTAASQAQKPARACRPSCG